MKERLRLIMRHASWNVVVVTISRFEYMSSGIIKLYRSSDFKKIKIHPKIAMRISCKICMMKTCHV